MLPHKFGIMTNFTQTSSFSCFSEKKFITLCWSGREKMAHSDERPCDYSHSSCPFRCLVFEHGGLLELRRRGNHSELTYSQLHTILRLFDVLPNFPFTKSETMLDYYL